MHTARVAVVLLFATFNAGRHATADDGALADWGHSTSPVAAAHFGPAEQQSPSFTSEGLLPKQQGLLRASLERDEGDLRVVQAGMSPSIVSDEQTWALVAPYVWMPATRGTVGARGTTTSVDVSLSDLFDHLDDLNGAFMGHVEVGRGDIGLIFDGMLMQLDLSQRLPLGGRAKLDIGTTILESLVMTRIVNVDTDVEGGEFIVDLLGGARYYQAANSIRITPAVGPAIQADLTKDWVDLVFGARTAVTLMPDLKGFFRADFGGFGIGTSSNLAWNLTTGVEYALSCHPGSSVILGYRVLDIDETQKSGDQKFVYDLQMRGPFTAVAIRF